jgi:hypothetical protein
MPEPRTITVACPACHQEQQQTLDVSLVPAMIVCQCSNPACHAIYRVKMAFDVELVQRKRRQWGLPMQVAK